MAEASGTNRAAIVTAIVALVGAVASAIFSAYSTITVASEKHSVERAALFRDLIQQLAVAQEEPARPSDQPAHLQVLRSKLALLNLWQLYPDEHKIIVLAALEIGQNELVETMIRLDEELTPHAPLLLAHARSRDPGIGDAAKRVLQEVDPLSAARIYVDELIGQLDAGSFNLSNNDKISTLIDISARDEEVRRHIDATAGEKPEHEPVLRYILYRSVRDKQLMPLLRARLASDGADDVTEILCCGFFHPEDQQELVAAVLAQVTDDREAKRFLVSWVANFLANPSLRIGGLSPSLDAVTAFCSDIVRDPAFYSQARANALRALSVWNPRQAVMLLAERLAEREEEAHVRFEIDALLRDSAFLAGALAGLEGDGGVLPAPDDPPADWGNWLDAVRS